MKTPFFSRFIRYHVVFLLFIFLATGCASLENSPTGNNKDTFLRVGVSANAPPLVYKRENKFAGLEVEMAQGLAATLGKEVHIIDLDWQDLMPALEDGKIDIIMSGMSITNLRDYRISFANPYLTTGQVSLIHRRDLARFSTGISDLMKPALKIGTVKGTTGSYFIRQAIARADQTDFSTPEKAVQSLLDKKIDVFIYDLPMNFYFAAQNEANGLTAAAIPLTREHLAWGIRRNDIALQNAANRYLATIRNNGTLKEMILRWIPFYQSIMSQ